MTNIMSKVAFLAARRVDIHAYSRAGRSIMQTMHQSSTRSNQKRYLSLHEYQSQGLLRDAGIAVPRGEVVTNSSEVPDVCRRIGLPSVIKAQVLAGGRGKGEFEDGLKGGVHVVDNTETASTISGRMLGSRLRTKQTNHAGLLVEKLYVTEKVDYHKEFYLAIAVDRNKRCPAIVVSQHGGMNIEAVAKRDPDSVARISLNYTQGVSDEVVAKVASTLGLTTSIQKDKLGSMLRKLYTLFKSKDATLLEINPLITTQSEDLICLDAKFNFDDASRLRQPEIFALEEPASRDIRETEAESLGFSYVRLDGNIGNIVNGAGLAMATLDAINIYGGKCSNFLDAGGKATKQTMVDAFRIVLSDDRVKVIFINIYGGIIHGDMVATSIIGAAKELGPLRIPLVVRLQGTSADKGQALLANCGLNIHSVADFTKAVQTAVELASK